MVLLARVLNILIRFFAAGALILGLAFWLGYALSFTRLHIALGIGLVASLWLLAAIVWKRGGHNGLIGFAVAWGAISWLFGFAHTRLLLGSWHWVVEVTHLAVGVLTVAIGLQLVNALTGRRGAGK